MTLPDLKPFVQSSTCLSCEGCCRFESVNSDWRAKAGQCEAEKIRSQVDEVTEDFPVGKIADGGYLKVTPCEALFRCVFFNPEDHSCAVYQDRPFECRLYPFVLTRQGERLSVSVHLACPEVQLVRSTDFFEQYLAELETYFQQPMVRSFLAGNLHLFGKYHGFEVELERVFDVEF